DFIAKVVASGAPIDGFGVGSSLDASSDAPTLDCAYKLQEYGGRARRKLSEGKVTWPGRKQVWREAGNDGMMTGDILTIEDDRQPGTALITPGRKGGKRAAAAARLGDIRAHAARELARLHEALRRAHTSIGAAVVS